MPPQRAQTAPPLADTTEQSDGVTVETMRAVPLEGEVWEVITAWERRIRAEAYPETTPASPPERVGSVRGDAVVAQGYVRLVEVGAEPHSGHGTCLEGFPQHGERTCTEGSERGPLGARATVVG